MDPTSQKPSVLTPQGGAEPRAGRAGRESSEHSVAAVVGVEAQQ